METVACLAGLLVNSESLRAEKSRSQCCRIEINTNISKRCHSGTFEWIQISVTGDTAEPKKKKSNALWPLEQQNGTFMMSPRFFPEIDGLSRNADWLIRRLAECAAVVRLLSCSFSGWNIQPGALGRMTNEEGYGRLRPRLSAGAAAIGHD